MRTGAAVPFRAVKQEVLPAIDEAEFGMRIELQITVDEEQADVSDVEDVLEWGAFGLLFILAQLSFADARARGASVNDFRHNDMLDLDDFVGGLRFDRGALRFEADYLRGRRMKTDIRVYPDGRVTLETRGRGKAPSLWIERLHGRAGLRLVGTRADPGDSTRP